MIRAFYLSEFIKTGHAYADNISDGTRQVIQEITSTNFRLLLISKGLFSRQSDSSTSNLSLRSQRPRSQSIEPPPFPQDWAIDRTALRRALAEFESATQDFISLVAQPAATTGPSSSSLGKRPETFTPNTSTSPPSTGNTPPTSSSAPTSTSPQRNPSTGATSADEAIFRHPIGPVMASGSHRDTPTGGGESSNANARSNNDDDLRQAGINQTQWAALQRLFSRPPGSPRGPSDPPPLGPSTTGNDNNYSQPWNVKELGFFNNNYSSKSVHSRGIAIEYVNSYIIFQNIYLFLERAKDLTTTKNTII